MNIDLFNKVSILGPDAQYDTCGPKDFGQTTDIPGVYHAKVGGNNICRLFKVLQTNVCKNNCKYCAFRKDRMTPRTTLSPDEMARAFDTVYSNKLVDGLFLSSGIAGSADYSMTKMLDTAHILRDKYRYNGYMHLKIMPGSSSSIIGESVKLANRVSINIESPTESDLALLSPDKNLKTGFYLTMARIKSEITKLKLNGVRRTPSVTTQFVVGAGKEKDKDIIRTTNFLYENFGLKRVFYSAFRPVSNTPLEDKPAESLTREYRLYQSDFLMRFYKFNPSDIPLDENGFLSEIDDPKLAWAKMHPEHFPVNLNKVGYWDLLKIPGVGPETAKKIIAIRKVRPIRYLSELLGQRIQVDKMSEYVRV